MSMVPATSSSRSHWLLAYTSWREANGQVIQTWAKAAASSSSRHVFRRDTALACVQPKECEMQRFCPSLRRRCLPSLCGLGGAHTGDSSAGLNLMLRTFGNCRRAACCFPGHADCAQSFACPILGGLRLPRLGLSGVSGWSFSGWLPGHTTGESHVEIRGFMPACLPWCCQDEAAVLAGLPPPPTRPKQHTKGSRNHKSRRVLRFSEVSGGRSAPTSVKVFLYSFGHRRLHSRPSCPREGRRVLQCIRILRHAKPPSASAEL